MFDLLVMWVLRISFYRDVYILNHNFFLLYYNHNWFFAILVVLINCEYSLQISEVKKNIETVQGVDVYPAAQQMLIHQGKVLKDDTTLEENKVAENSFLVIMLSKVNLSFITFSCWKTALILLTKTSIILLQTCFLNFKSFFCCTIFIMLCFGWLVWNFICQLKY